MTVELNRPIIIISIEFLENQPVSSFMGKTIILKQAAATLKEDANIFVQTTSGVP